LCDRVPEGIRVQPMQIRRVLQQVQRVGVAVFSDIGGLRNGSPVVVAGVDVGLVESISLVDYEARVVLQINPGLEIHEDAVVSVKTRGLIGEKFVQISAGAAEAVIKPGGRIRQTESAVDIEALISKYAFGNL